MNLNPVDLVWAIAAVAFLVGQVALAARVLDWRPLRRRRRVLVALRTGETLSGVLVARRPTYLELGRVEVHTGGGGASSTVDGTLQVDRSNVMWVQVP